MEDLSQLLRRYNGIKEKGLKLDMSRGKPPREAIELSAELLTALIADNGNGGFISRDGIDCLNYGILDGLPEAKELFAPMLGVHTDELIIGGNSSLQLMYDAIVRAMLLGVSDNGKGWAKQTFEKSENVRFLCPVPGYDRHFAICEALGIEMLPVPTNSNGPDMDLVERLVADDDSIKGIWCVPMYSNPTGITYSDETVKRLASMPTKADDFRIFWDCAYIIHHLESETHGERDVLLNILDECKKANCPDKVYMFASTSKVTFPGGGIAMMAASERNVAFIKKHMSFQTIGGDKINQLRHVRFFKDYSALMKHMEKLGGILKTKFDAVSEILERELGTLNIGEWHKPKGGYFISFNAPKGTAKRIVQLCKEAGVIITDAGATYPYGNDDDDSNIRIAPSFPPLDELRAAMEVFCLSVKIAVAEGDGGTEGR